MKLKKYLTPAEYIIHVFGNANRAAKSIGRSRQCVYKWRDSDGGKITHLAFDSIFEACKSNGFEIKFEDLVNGRMVEK